MKEKIVNLFKSLLHSKSKWFTIIVPVLLLGIVFLMLTINNVYTETYDIERFNRAKETIRSPITIENEIETKRKTRETIQSVEDRYDISDEITEERVHYIEEIFDAVSKIDKEYKENSDVLIEDEEDTNHTLLTNQEKLQNLRQLLSPEITSMIDDIVLSQLIKLNKDDRETGKEVFIRELTKSLDQGIRKENIEKTITDMQESIKYTELDEEIKQPLIDLSEFAIVENSFFDDDKTIDVRKEAARSVEPVMINAGEMIVREGQIITNEIYEELKLTGLLNKERNIYPVLGLILLIILTIGIIANEMNQMNRQNKLDNGKIFSILFISIIIISLMKVISLFTTQVNELFFVVPVATGVLLVKQLIHERLAIILATLYAILGSIIFNGEIPGLLNVEAGIYFYFAQIGAILSLRNVQDRLAIVKAGIGMSLVNITTVLLFIFLSFEKYSLTDLFLQSSFGIASALLSAVLTLGLLPFFETGLGVLSDTKLIALANPNQPLLRKLLLETPGTYHHSIMVANLSETACEAIGANGLLARVGAYYHDIGKTVRPHYYIENQLSIKNPHDVIKPSQSAEIILSHPYDGVMMLREQKLPKEIIDIAKEHHGTTLLKYFYYKEKEHNEDVQEEDYRYPGPKPQTKEAATVCICDSVEAAVRSLEEPTEKNIDEIVSSIINERLMDGQLDDCLLTLKELKSIRTTVCETLKGIFHSRIHYPMKEAD